MNYQSQAECAAGPGCQAAVAHASGWRAAGMAALARRVRRRQQRGQAVQAGTVVAARGLEHNVVYRVRTSLRTLILVFWPQ